VHKLKYAQIERLRSTYQRLSSAVDTATLSDQEFVLEIPSPLLRSMFDEARNAVAMASPRIDEAKQIIALIRGLIRQCRGCVQQRATRTLTTRDDRLNAGFALAILQTKLVPHLLRRSPELVEAYLSCRQRLQRLQWLNLEGWVFNYVVAFGQQ
jgi:hypothetical protein